MFHVKHRKETVDKLIIDLSTILIMSEQEYMVFIGKACRRYRVEVMKISQAVVALETGYTVQHISKFERGQTNNMMIFVWYLKQGFRL